MFGIALKGLFAGGVLAVFATPLAAQLLEGQYRVHGVENQFAKLNPQGEPIGFQLGVADDPQLCKHYQGVARTHGAGTAFMFITRSANPTDSCGAQSEEPGELVVVQWGSRGTDGERLRSNKVAFGQNFDDTQPPLSDRAEAHFHFNCQNGWPAYCHAGGIQLAGNVLLVPLEDEVNDVCGGGDDNGGGVMFLNVTNPLAPVPIRFWDFNYKIGVLAVTFDPVNNWWLLLVTSGSFDGGSYVEFWRSTNSNLYGLEDAELAWTLVDVWDADQADALTHEKWSGDVEYQAINFVRDEDGTLYVIGLDNTDAYAAGGTNWARLFRVEQDAQGLYRIVYVNEKRLKLNDPFMGDLDAMGGVYVTPSGQLVIYTGEHDNDGPGGTIRMGEFRFRDVDDADPAGCFGWVSFYENYAGWVDVDSRGYCVDYRDRDLDNWNWLPSFEDMGDKTSSLLWAIPRGRYARLWDQVAYGGGYFDLIGTGDVGFLNDLSTIGFNDRIESIQFIDRNGEVFVNTEQDPYCLSYYPLHGSGSWDCPFWGTGAIQSAVEALDAPSCVGVGGTVYLAPGDYSANVHIEIPLTLRPRSAGVVRITAP